jgi:hypothetical protein
MNATTIKNCRFRYLNDSSHVFYITRASNPRPLSFANTEYYTAPFFSKERNEVRNVLIAYIDLAMCHAKKKEVSELVPVSLDLRVNAVSLKGFKDMASYFEMPALVITKAYCNVEDSSEHIEAYYYGNQKNNAHTI